MELLRVVMCVGLVVCVSLVYEAKAERAVSWEALEAALREAQREALLEELYNQDGRDKRGPMNFRFRGAKRNVGESPSATVVAASLPAPAASALDSDARPKRSPMNFRFRGAKRAPSSGFFGMRGKKDEYDSYYNGGFVDDAFEAEKRGPMNFRFRGA